MKYVKSDLGGATAADDWQVMNSRNQRMMADFMKSSETQVNKGRQIGVKMIEWTD